MTLAVTGHSLAIPIREGCPIIDLLASRLQPHSTGWHPVTKTSPIVVVSWTLVVVSWTPQAHLLINLFVEEDSMPTFHDPVAGADEAHEVLRGLAHATRTFHDPSQTYDVIGDLLSSIRSLEQVLNQVAAAHLDHQDRTLSEAGDPAVGAAHASRAADALRAAALQLGNVEINVDLASQHSGQIVWQASRRPTTETGANNEFAAHRDHTLPFSRPQERPQRGLTL